MKEPNLYLVWLKQMPKENKEHFLNRAFDNYMKAWEFQDKTGEMIGRRLASILENYMKTDEFVAEIKARASQLLTEATASNNILHEIIKYLKED